jgi:hypothetical protein
MTDVQRAVERSAGRDAILGRPDRFVAWRQAGETSAPQAEPLGSLSRIHGR